MEVTGVPIQSSVESETSFKSFPGHSEPTHGAVGCVLLVLVDNTEPSTVVGQVINCCCALIDVVQSNQRAIPIYQLKIKFKT